MENTKKVAANAATAFIANGDLRLSDHFKLREFTLSGAAIRYNLDNTPTTVEVERLRALCVNVLESVAKTGARWIHVSYKATGNRREFFTLKR